MHRGILLFFYSIKDGCYQHEDAAYRYQDVGVDEAVAFPLFHQLYGRCALTDGLWR